MLKRVFIGTLVVFASFNVSADEATATAQRTADTALRTAYQNSDSINHHADVLNLYGSGIMSNSDQIAQNQKLSSQGIAGLAAIRDVMPSAPGKTAAAVGGGFYDGESAIGVSIAHRFDAAYAPVIFAGVGSASDDPVYKIGAQIEW